MPTIAVAYTIPELETIARRLALRLDIPLTGSGVADAELQLRVAPHASGPGYRVELQQLGPDAPGPIVVDFVGGAVGHRRRVGEGRKQPLARAVGLKHGATPTVLDATAGLGRDAFVLATLGCTLTLIERNPIIAALLENGLQRARANAETAPVVARMALQCTDARSYLESLNDSAQPDVIYLDPMYPHRTKTAAVKKEMRALQTLLGEDGDADLLLKLALRCAQHRVVVKRPRSADNLGSQAPHHCIVSPNTRFDVYLTD